MTRARVAILGIGLESNAFAPPTTLADFTGGRAAGEEVLDMLHGEHAFVAPFGRELSRLRRWEPVPILLAHAESGGPLVHSDFTHLREDLRRRLVAELPVDAVAVLGHGAGTTTEHDDLDGAYLAAVRAIVGPAVPIVVVLDLHGNVSDAMVEAADVLIAYRTNPHVDHPEREEEAARAIHELLQGEPCHTAFTRLPLCTPQVSQLTALGEPYGDLIAQGQHEMTAVIRNVSILSGFVLGDTSYNGTAVLVNGRGDPDDADALALRLAQRGWDDRHRYHRQLTDVAEATRLAVTAGAGTTVPPVLLADISDNPGGGGRSNTTWLLEALHTAGAQGVQMGLFYDPVLAQEAASLGVGSVFEARFNRDEPHELSRPFRAAATVRRLPPPNVVPTRGVMRDRLVDLGTACLLDLGGIAVAVVSVRQQLFDAGTLAHFGLDPAAARTVVVKSRGHFRAGFSHLFTPERVVEVDAPGLTTSRLSELRWQRLPRPVFPLDLDTSWAPSLRRSAQAMQEPSP